MIIKLNKAPQLTARASFENVKVLDARGFGIVKSAEIEAYKLFN
jgi:hypothetical protein